MVGGKSTAIIPANFCRSDSPTGTRDGRRPPRQRAQLFNSVVTGLLAGRLPFPIGMLPGFPQACHQEIGPRYGRTIKNGKRQNLPFFPL